MSRRKRATAPQQPPLPALLPDDDLVAQARSSAITDLFRNALKWLRRTGQDQRFKLKNGAEVVVGKRGTTIWLTIKRQGAPVGLVEEATFRRDCLVPEHARRVPEVGQEHAPDGFIRPDTIHYFRLAWEDDGWLGEQALFPEAEP